MNVEKGWAREGGGRGGRALAGGPSALVELASFRRTARAFTPRALPPLRALPPARPTGRRPETQRGDLFRTEGREVSRKKRVAQLSRN